MPVPAVSRFIRRHYGRQGFIPSALTGLVDAYVSSRVASDVKRIEPHLKQNEKILDIGLGGGMVYRVLRDKEYDMTGVDVSNLSMYPDIEPLIYNGSDLPFKNRQFDAVILDRVLHHCGKNQERVLKEAMRVSGRVLVIEDIYHNRFEKLLVALNDSMCNWEWYSHHYRNKQEWEVLIKSLSGSLAHFEYWVEIPQWTIYVTHGLFVVDSP